VAEVGVIKLPGSNPAGILAAFRRIQIRAELLQRAEDVGKFRRIVIPGVGNFGPASAYLWDSGIAVKVKEQIAAGVPTLGICLGFQLLCSESEESQKSRGLGVLEGRARRLTGSADRRVPHIGWSKLNSLTVPTTFGIEGADVFYFAHSYEVTGDFSLGEVVLADYAGTRFVAAVAIENVLGVQFHPEKSNAAGLRLLRNFVSS